MAVLAEKLLGLAGWKPGAWRWALATSWWLLLGLPLRRGLRSALGGLGPPPTQPQPPTRPRRPRATQARPRSSQSYPSAA